MLALSLFIVGTTLIAAGIGIALGILVIALTEWIS